MTESATTTITNNPDGARRVRGRAGDSTVVARRLTKSFGDAEVIHSLDLTIEPGTIVGLIGPSGCGKTTTVRLLTGLLTPTSGEASIGGKPSIELTAADRARMGYLPQTPALFPDLSLIENLSFHASMYGLPFRRRERLDELLDWVELSNDRSKRVADASGGMQRRLALAAAFVQDPDIVFLDEPTAGIDPILRDKLWAKFRTVAETGKTLVVTTQYVGEAGKCDQVGLLSEGELLLLDTPENLRRAAFAGEVVDVVLERPLDDAALVALSDREFVVGEIERIDAQGIRIVVDDADRAITDLENALASIGARAVEMNEHVVDYDEAFVRVVERHRNANARSGTDLDGPARQRTGDRPHLTTDVTMTDGVGSRDERLRGGGLIGVGSRDEGSRGGGLIGNGSRDERSRGGLIGDGSRDERSRGGGLIGDGSRDEGSHGGGLGAAFDDRTTNETGGRA